MRSHSTFDEATLKSRSIEQDLAQNPKRYRVLTGDRPTGPLHIGHYFGTLQNRVRLQNLGIQTFVLIADYQVLTDRDSSTAIASYVEELLLDYLAIGLDPIKTDTVIFNHSAIPELNQLLIPFLTLVSVPELERNPTVKDEIRAAGLNLINGAMLTYPVHQAADILFCKGNLVPVGKDQLPHLELARKIARRFNERYAPVFPEPDALLSNAPTILGLDGHQKMSKSRNNALFLRSTADETARLIKTAKTDSERLITYEPDRRPEVANLLRLIGLCTEQTPEAIAHQIGDQGSGKLKTLLIEALNAYFAPVREYRCQLESDRSYLRQILQEGNSKARKIAIETLAEVSKAMKMCY
ncbi:MAG: tryptophan--tRNA ligase [Myxococcaceae bacterium]|nr:tryptophan--tRNA ligase [Myxococcaceae bacterium]MBH2006474.1 tryptophan--tRNA ligase [Myxococcaceae bacterium]